MGQLNACPHLSALYLPWCWLCGLPLAHLAAIIKMTKSRPKWLFILLVLLLRLLLLLMLLPLPLRLVFALCSWRLLFAAAVARLAVVPVVAAFVILWVFFVANATISICIWISISIAICRMRCLCKLRKGLWFHCICIIPKCCWHLQANRKKIKQHQHKTPKTKHQKFQPKFISQNNNCNWV